MKTSYVWYDCLIKELNIQDKYKNLDCLSLRPIRQDLFWVQVQKNEIGQLLTRIKDQKHKALIREKMNASDDKDYFFFISRDGNYVQNYSFLMLNSPGSLWQAFVDTRFDDINKLTYIAKKEALNRLEEFKAAKRVEAKKLETIKEFHAAYDYYPGA
jgi:hypothetical protein